MAKNPQEVARKWQANTASSTSSMRSGAEAVSVAPTQLAKQQIPRMVAGIQEAAASGKIARGLDRVSLSDWQQAYITKGIPRIASGVAAAEPKFESFMASFLPFAERVRSSLPPRGDLEQNLQRMVANARGLSEYKSRE
tara:strand:- start:816 stop:1232 length:417 start_codon:yes stop_codon:yes gene_type:complete